MSVFGSSFGTPNVCPHCRNQVDVTAYGTVSPHTVRPTGAPCTGAGLPAAPVPPWPGFARTINPARGERRFSLRRRRADRRDVDRLPTAS